MHVSSDSSEMDPQPKNAEDYSFNDVFSLRRPRDAKAGLSSGGKSAAKGLAVGVLGLVVAPIAGAVQDGAAGFAKGLASGKPPCSAACSSSQNCDKAPCGQLGCGRNCSSGQRQYKAGRTGCLLTHPFDKYKGKFQSAVRGQYAVRPIHLA